MQRYEFSRFLQEKHVENLQKLNSINNTPPYLTKSYIKNVV
jgi:hypothetical protein